MTLSNLGREKIVEMLIKYGANVNAVDEHKQTPLIVAAMYGNLSFSPHRIDFKNKCNF